MKEYTYKGETYYKAFAGDKGFYESPTSFRQVSFLSDIYTTDGEIRVSIIGGDAIQRHSGFEDFADFWEVATPVKTLWKYSPTH